MLAIVGLVAAAFSLKASPGFIFPIMKPLPLYAIIECNCCECWVNEITRQARYDTTPKIEPTLLVRKKKAGRKSQAVSK